MLVANSKPYQATGTEASWYRGWEITPERRERFRQTSLVSQAAKSRAIKGECDLPKYPIPRARLKIDDLMPSSSPNGLGALSLFSGGGGLDIGFDRAGFSHIASYEIREDAASVLRTARPNWTVYSGDKGDVCNADWRRYQNRVDVLHGGPPCQPFSHAGYRSGASDVRDMFPQLVRAIAVIQPRAFVAENVAGLATPKFSDYLENNVLAPLRGRYVIRMFVLDAASFGVPQRRKRVWLVGFRSEKDAAQFQPPLATHSADAINLYLPMTMGAREALGLLDIGYDGLAPTIRSGFSGPRHTTSVVNSVSASREWERLGIWPNGVAQDRKKASAFVAKNNTFRLSIPDCMLLQGFPEEWPFSGAVYKSLGLIGNSVAPPMAYQIALGVGRALAVR